MVSNQAPSEGLNGALARTLNGERAAAKVSFDQLASLTGISKRTLLRVLSTMERDIDVRVLSLVAQALGLSAVDVMVMAEQRLERESRADRPESDTSATA